jgi:hypothetical protein
MTAADNIAASTSTEFICEGDHRQMELDCVTIGSSGRWRFVTIQTPGGAFAITGQWEKGLLRPTSPFRP